MDQVSSAHKLGPDRKSVNQIQTVNSGIVDGPTHGHEAESHAN